MLQGRQARRVIKGLREQQALRGLLVRQARCKALRVQRAQQGQLVQLVRHLRFKDLRGLQDLRAHKALREM